MTARVEGTGVSDPFGYGGQWGYYTDAAGRDTGFILCTHRYYDPNTGRWLTRDPIGYEGGINLYGYVGGDPVNAVDPEGLRSVTVHRPLNTDISSLEWCLRWCFKKNVNLTGCAIGVNGLGAPIVAKPFYQGGSENTSVASIVFRKTTRQARLPFKVYAPTRHLPKHFSSKLGTVLGRWTSIAGVALTVWDIAKITKCTRKCNDNMNDPDQQEMATISSR